MLRTKSHCAPNFACSAQRRRGGPGPRVALSAMKRQSHRTPEEVTFIPYTPGPIGPGQMMGDSHSESTARPAPRPASHRRHARRQRAKNRTPSKPTMIHPHPPTRLSIRLVDRRPRARPVDRVRVCQAATVSEAALYCSMTRPRRRPCPRLVRILYRDGTAWKPVDATGEYGVEKDRYNKIAFVRLRQQPSREVTMQPSYSAGIQRWRVK